MSNIENTRICVQQILPIHQAEIQNIRQHPQHNKLQAAFWAKKLWPTNSKIRIAFLDSGENITKTNIQVLKNAGGNYSGPIDPLQNIVPSYTVQEMIKKVVNERIKPLVNLDIEFVNHPKDANVRISFDPDGGAWSLVGTDALHQKTGATMNLGWIDVPTCIHEFGHMLGMIHEHQNPRGQKIEWDDNEVFKWAETTQGWSKNTTEKNIIDKYDISSINGSVFDPLSVMLYFFPAKLTLNHKGTHQNLRLSGLDVQWISKMYPKTGGESPNQFYERVYDESIQDSIHKSILDRYSFVNDNNNYTVYWIIAISIIVILILVVLWLLLSKNL